MDDTSNLFWLGFVCLIVAVDSSFIVCSNQYSRVDLLYLSLVKKWLDGYEVLFLKGTK